MPSIGRVVTLGGSDQRLDKMANPSVLDQLAADLGQMFGILSGLENLTACADYKLPQVLRRYGILSYSPDLAYKIDAQIPLRKGSQEEVEIRANTIWAVELMKKALKKRLPGVDSIHVNDHLWLLSQQKGFYHLTRTTAY